MQTGRPLQVHGHDLVPAEAAASVLGSAAAVALGACNHANDQDWPTRCWAPGRSGRALAIMRALPQLQICPIHKDDLIGIEYSSMPMCSVMVGQACDGRR